MPEFAPEFLKLMRERALESVRKIELQTRKRAAEAAAKKKQVEAK